MEREDFEKIVKKHFSFKLKKELKEKQISNIMKYIAKDIAENDIIGFDDIGFIKNGKSGFLITKDAFYNGPNVKIPFKGLERITYVKENSVTVQTTFHYADGSTLENEIIIARAEEFIDMLREIARGYNAETIIVRTRKQKAVAKVAVEESEIQKVEVPENINYEELGEEYYQANDYETAYKYLMKGAEEGNARCMNKIGLIYYYGKLGEKDYAKALDWYKKSGDAGFPRAYGNIGYYYEYVENNEKEGFNWYEKGALAGNAYCQYMTGVRLENVANGVPQDLFKAYYWYTRSAEQNNERAYYYLGNMYKKGNGVPKDLGKAFEYFKKAAELGDKQAKEELAAYDETGNCIIKPVEVISKPVKEVSKESETKNVKAAKAPEPSGKELVIQGYNYQEGRGVSSDSKKAFECYEKAVEQNYVPAYYYLANMYKKGWYVTQSNEKACELLVKGAELDDKRAMDELIEGTAHGIYIPSKNMLKKMVEYGKTVLAGDSYFKPFLERIEVLASVEGEVEAFLCFTANDLSQGVICPKCENVLYPVPGKQLVYCTKCFTMVKAENAKRKQPAKPEEKIVVSTPIEKVPEENVKKSKAILPEENIKKSKVTLTEQKVTDAARKVEKSMAEYASDGVWESNINVAVLGKNEKGKAEFINKIKYIFDSELKALGINVKRKAITVPEWMGKKSTDYVASVIVETLKENFCLIDCVNDLECVRAMLQSPVRWNAVIIEWDLADSVKANADMLIGWAQEAKQAKVPYMMIYFKKKSFDDKEENKLLEIAKKEMMKYLEQYYGGKIIFFKGLVSGELYDEDPIKEMIYDLQVRIRMPKTPEYCSNNDSYAEKGYLEKIEYIKQELEVIRQKNLELTPLADKEIHMLYGWIAPQKIPIYLRGINCFKPYMDIDMVKLHVSDEKFERGYWIEIQDLDKNDRVETASKPYDYLAEANEAIREMRSSFANEKVRSTMLSESENNRKDINVAVLGVNEKEKASLISSILHTTIREVKPTFVEEVLKKKATEYIACVKENMRFDKLNLYDTIEDKGCVRELLCSPVNFRAAIVTIDLVRETDVETIRRWAYWAELAKIPKIIVYQERETLDDMNEDEDIIEEFRECSEAYMLDILSEYYTGTIYFHTASASKAMNDFFGEDAENIRDMIANIEN